ncbi:MAG TPA: TolC family protein, partial [Chitinophagaceae bacterium]|nr:TolC family protein [Chitinophagaceae bacterium]
TQQKLQTQWQQAYQEYLKYKQTTDYYTTSGLQLANEQIRVAQISFSKGEIGYVEFVQNISLAIESKLNYLSAINALNTAVINLQYLQGNQQ